MFAKKLSRVTVCAAVLALALMCTRARADGPKLPASAVGDETFAVITLNVSKMDPANVEAAAKAVLGANFAMVQDGLIKYKEKYQEMSDGGAESANIVFSGKPDDKEPKTVIYVKMKPGADRAAAGKKIHDAQAKEGKGEETDIANEGDFMVMHKKGTEMPAGGATDRAKTFADAGSTDKALSIVFTPTEAIRAKMREQQAANGAPLWVKSVAPLLADSKWMTLDASLGDAPTLGVAVQAADETAAKGIADAVTQGGQQLKAQADQMKQQGPQLAPMAEAFGSLADALKPTQSGSKVTLSVDGKVIGPVVANMLPFMMMGQQQGRRPAGAGL